MYVKGHESEKEMEEIDGYFEHFMVLVFQTYYPN